VEISFLSVLLTFIVTCLFGWLYYLTRSPVPKKEPPLEMTGALCPHKKIEHHYFSDTCAGNNTPVMVVVRTCHDCRTTLPQETSTLARFSPEIIQEIHQKLLKQGYETSALPLVPTPETENAL
jgi:hypothetical protein